MGFTLGKLSCSLALSLQRHPPETVLVSACRSKGKEKGAARDRVIDFGKHKGKMLGALPSAYLKWVSKNLRARDFEEWATLADQVLQDPVYQDRIQWEFAQAILTGDGAAAAPHDAASALSEISERYGWDSDGTHTAKAAWKNVNFELLGTSKGGRIPRINSTQSDTSGSESESKTKTQNTLQGGRRRERRDRLRSKRQTSASESRSKPRGAVNRTEIKHAPNTRTNSPNITNPFPGRQTLLNLAIKPHSRPSSSSSSSS